MPAIRTKTGQFSRGYSGNPSGRPKRTDAEKDMLAAIYELAPTAVNRLRTLLNDESTPAHIQLRCIEIIMERVAGKPMTLEQIENNEERIDFSCML